MRIDSNTRRGAARPVPTHRRSVIAWMLFLALLLLGTGCAPRSPGVALVIGNSNYRHAASLANPENDARAVSDRLEELGWDVALAIDPTRSELEQSVRSFDQALSESKKAVFFYAGHGMQINGKNYLIPVDFKPSKRIDLERETVPLDEALGWMKRPDNQLAVFLDACRDNPFESQIASARTRGLAIVESTPSTPSSRSTRSGAQIQLGRGLAEVDTSAGTFIAYATQPGNVALDGGGTHSPFTEALLEYLPKNNKDIGWVLQQVRKDVLESTGGKQVPWDHSSLTNPFVVNPKQRAAPPP